jgi:NAD(P)-dependent dehydrogenase (short-subunit alcohol dehydrogenase family)
MLSVCLAQELGTQGFVVCAVHPGRLKTDSGASDADTEPAEAAERFANWIDKINSSMNGKCFDLENETLMKW